jgi:Ca2+-binding RTX toxin-like protein
MSYTPNATAGDDILTGDAQPDVIDALEGDDIVFGGGGDDELLGGPGNDRLYGEAGNDRLLGGTGDDRYQVDRTDMVTEQVDEGTDSVYFRDDSFTGIYFLAANVENLTMIGRFNNLSAFGNSLDNRIYGNNTGNDTLLGGARNDYIQGDFAYLNGSNSFSSDTGEDLLRGGAGDDVIWGDQGEGKELIHSLANDRLYGDNGDDFLYGQAGADVLDGGLGNDALYGGAGNDVLDGGFDLLPPGKEADLFGSDYFPGNDMLAGGAGDDVYLFGRSSRSDRVLETAAAGEANQLRFEDGVIAADVAVRHEGNDLNFYIVGFADNKLSVGDYFSASARPLTTAVFSDGTVWTTAEFDAAPLGPVGNGDRFIRGTDGNETLRGPDGNDTIDGKDGADRIFGGGGNDYLLGGAGRDVLSGDAGDDLLNGGGDGDRLLGGTGADTLLGDIGDDFLDGGAGPDVLDGGAGANRLIFQRGDGQDIVRGAATSGGADRTSLELVSSYAVGSLGAVPVGIASSEVTLTRQGDHLVIDRNDGDDRITVENYFTLAPGNLYPVHAIQFSDTAWNNADINARVVSGDPVPPVPAGTTQTGTPGNDVVTGTTGDDTLFGRAGNDQLSGGAGNDFLNGELGNDVMTGGAGDDMLIVDSTQDVVDEQPGEGADTVQSYISYALGANVENLILIGDAAQEATGNLLDNFMTGNAQDNILRAGAGNDVLYGHSGNDFLNGELGQDQMFGGIGNDTVIVDDAGDYVWEAEGEGMDTVQSYISYALQDNFEILILIGQTGVVANGNALANLIRGNDADNVIDGRGGQDSLWGLGGNDALTIHSGQEDVSGGMGVDTLRVAAELGMLDLAGRAGQTFTGLEAIDLTNSSATTLRLTMGSLMAMSTESDSLQIDGDAGDVLQIESGWVKSATATAGYDQYVKTEDPDIGVLLVAQAVMVAVGAWV